MAKFVLFILSFIANFIVIKFIPPQDLQPFINIYAGIGGCMALFFFYIYTHNKLIKKIKPIGSILVLSFIFSCSMAGSYISCMLFYPAFLIYNDYMITQGEYKNKQKYYRLFLIISALPFLFLSNLFAEIFQSRLILLVMLTLIFIAKKSKIENIKITSTYKYIIINYVFYYVPLFLLANMGLVDESLRVWYIFSQSGLVIILKYLDYIIRGNNEDSIFLGGVVLAVSVLAPVMPFILFQNNGALLIYYVGLLGLYFSKRYI